MIELRKRLEISTQDLLWQTSDDQCEYRVSKMRKCPINLVKFRPRITLFPTLFDIFNKAIGHFSYNYGYKTKLGYRREESVAHDIRLGLSYLRKLVILIEYRFSNMSFVSHQFFQERHV